SPGKLRQNSGLSFAKLCFRGHTKVAGKLKLSRSSRDQMKLLKPATGLILLTLTLATSRSWSCGETTTTIFSLPTLGGSGLSISAMNSTGQLAGFSYTAGNAEQHAVLFGDGVLTDL